MTMHFDIARQIGAVSRGVESREHNGRPARVVVASRTYDTTIDDLWDAVTTAERIPRWLLPISGDLRLGGRYQLEGNAGGEITRCEPPRRLEVTWEFGGQVSWVEASLAPEPEGGTRLEVKHIALVDAMWNEYGPGAAGVGWDLMVLGLHHHLSTGGGVDPAEAAAWLGSEEGKEFARLSSDAWYHASVAAGTDAAAARLAADRTTSAYTGTGDAASEPDAGAAPASGDSDTDG